MKKDILTTSVFVALLLAGTVVSAEEQYPAADFQPTVVYSDATASNASPAAASATTSGAAVVTTTDSASKAESSNTFLFGVVILAVAGGFFLSRKSSKTKASSSPSVSYYSGHDGVTGVEKYIQAKNISTATGVEKYLARKEAIERETSTTSVEKYVRSRS